MHLQCAKMGTFAALCYMRLPPLFCQRAGAVFPSEVHECMLGCTADGSVWALRSVLVKVHSQGPAMCKCMLRLQPLLVLTCRNPFQHLA